MALKRKVYPSAADAVQSKRHHFDGEEEVNASQSTTAQVDPTYGQRSAFPGLDSLASEDDYFYGPAVDGLEYLRMVRSEAKGVPNLLTSARIEGENLYQDYAQGYYEDGAYTAIPPPLAHGTTKIEEDDLDPQEAYYASLQAQFRSLRTALNDSLPPVASSQSTTTMATKLNDGASSRIWRMTILYTKPTSMLLSQLNQDTVVAGIAALERHIAWKTLEKESYMGAWAWCLLARCREVGMMGSEEVGVIRDLGKKARGMLRLLSAGLGGAQETQTEQNEERCEGEEDELGEKAMVGKREDDGGQDVRGDGTNGVKAVGTVAPTEGIAIHKDSEGRQSTGSAHDVLDSGDADLSGRNPSVSVQGNHRLPKIDDNETAEAQQRLLTNLPQTDRSPLQDAPTASNDSFPSSPRQRDPKSATQTSVLIPHEGLTSNNRLSPDNPVPLATRITATLDMIITIAGEAYGQRDLLEERMVWD
ncbi:MAG: hypothetical protein Q9171_001635 [Xanthocarpia ochracea]